MLKEKIVTIETGRDAGKTFLVQEMPASRLEKWAARALLALFGGNVPMDIFQTGKTSTALALAKTIRSGMGALSWEAVEPIYDELLTCVSRVPDATKPQNRVPLTPGNIDAHVEDVSTLVTLRLSVLEVCFSFFEQDGGLLSQIKAAPARKRS